MLEKIRTLLELRRREAERPFADQALRLVIDEVAAAWPFTHAAVDMSPASAGVYLLYRNGRLIYVGLAVHGSGIRQELASHLAGAHGECTRNATAFTYELARDPRALHQRYLAAHRARCDGGLPPCNEYEGRRA